MFRDGDEIGALTNLCAHQNGPLGEGRIIDGCVTCPWHGYQYRLADGCAPPPFTEKLVTYRVRIKRRHGRGRPAPAAAGHAGRDQMSAQRAMSHSRREQRHGRGRKLDRHRQRRRACPRRRCNRVTAKNRELAVSFKDGQFGVVSNTCNHVGGPLGDGRLDGDYIVCPWHNWKFHRCSGMGEPGFEEDRVPAYPVKVEDGRVLVDLAAGTKRTNASRTRRIRCRARSSARPGRCGSPAFRPSAMDAANPRFSGSDHLLDHALDSRAPSTAPRRG